jgi:hypothetical protein
VAKLSGRVATPALASIAAVAGVLGHSLDEIGAEVSRPDEPDQPDGEVERTGPDAGHASSRPPDLPRRQAMASRSEAARTNMTSAMPASSTRHARGVANSGRRSAAP